MTTKTMTLKDWRAGKKITQQAAADMIGTSRSNYAQIELSTARPSYELARAIQKATRGKVKSAGWYPATPTAPKRAK